MDEINKVITKGIDSSVLLCNGRVQPSRDRGNVDVRPVISLVLRG